MGLARHGTTRSAGPSPGGARARHVAKSARWQRTAKPLVSDSDFIDTYSSERLRACLLHAHVTEPSELALREGLTLCNLIDGATQLAIHDCQQYQRHDQLDSQQMLMRRQDEDLDDLTVAARRVGQMGLQIGDEIELQTQVMGEVEEEMDTTRSRLKTAQKMMNKLGKKMGKWQSVVMGGLVVLLIILMAVAFG